MAQRKTKPAGKARKSSKPAKAARAPKATPAAPAKERDPRLPAVGTTIVREYKGKEIRVQVLESGFKHDGTEYRSLSALASKLCGNPANGFLWFGLIPRPAPKTRAAKHETPELVTASA